jgi:DNA-binding response OmpR family regulator
MAVGKSMNLRTKILLITGMSLVVLTVTISLLASSIVLKSFAEYEQQEMQEDTERSLFALHSEVKELDRFARDWGSWDQTYEFIVNPYDAYINEHMGSDFGAEFKKTADLQTIPVLLYTVLEENRLGLQLGASAYLTKPIDEQHLNTTVSRLVLDGGTILVIDDDPDVLEVITQELAQQSNFQVITAKNGQVGLDLIAERQPDLVILDLMMPEVDGFEVLEKLDHHADVVPPVVVLTAQELTEEEQLYLDQRVLRAFAKNATTTERLLNKVNMLLAKQRCSKHHNGAEKSDTTKGE